MVRILIGNQAKELLLTRYQGIYRQVKDSSAKQRLWWAVYHGDRFTSLLLGLPHGFGDGYYSTTLGTMGEKFGPLEHQFVLRCALLAGKIIDRNIMPGKPSFAKTMDLDEQMEAIAALMPDVWWLVPSELPIAGPDLESLIERLLQQFYFFHVRTYLHLPFMAMSAAKTSPSNVSRLACIEASRHLLRRFRILRAEVQGACLFECKTSDFIGFTAAVLLVLGLSVSGNVPNQGERVEDLGLVSFVEDMFRREEERTGCKISSQSRKVLRALSASLDHNSQNTSLLEESKQITIPYFGTILQRRMEQAPNHPHSAPILAPSTAGSSAGDQDWRENTAVPIFEYAGYELPNPILRNVDFDGNGFGGFGAAVDSSSWVGATMMDLDQDWDTFNAAYFAPSSGI
jgi:hypothetical protein